MTQEQLIRRVQDFGYKFIDGLLDSNSTNVYHIIALCRKPDEWEPYKAPRHFQECGAIALWWFFDDELTVKNGKGEMIYDPTTCELRDNTGDKTTWCDKIAAVHCRECSLAFCEEHKGNRECPDCGGTDFSECLPVNTKTHELLTPEELSEYMDGLTDGVRDTVLSRLQRVCSYVPVDPWNDAPRSDTE